MVKKAFFHVIEFIGLVLIVSLIYISLNFFVNQNNYAYEKKSFEMEHFNLLKNLDNIEIESFFGAPNFNQSNFSALETYIKKSTNKNIKIEYFDGVTCYLENMSNQCENITLKEDAFVAEYTFAGVEKPITVKLYLGP
ncbi:MAG: hypothetical protein QW625_00450 [Candidatus Nanoarchaeia archaeon]